MWIECRVRNEFRNFIMVDFLLIVLWIVLCTVLSCSLFKHKQICKPFNCWFIIPYCVFCFVFYLRFVCMYNTNLVESNGWTMDTVSELAGSRPNSRYYHFNDGYFFVNSNIKRNIYLKCKERKKTRFTQLGQQCLKDLKTVQYKYLLLPWNIITSQTNWGKGS